LQILVIFSLQFLAVFAFNNDIGVYKTDMAVQREQFVIGQALLLSGNDTDLNIVATKNLE
jgi:hypothetical protein